MYEIIRPTMSVAETVEPPRSRRNKAEGIREIAMR
jgi:hypothetical protein